ncbi:MAG: elongation factor P [bacterium]|nr:elongation factor P [bacterium]
MISSNDLRPGTTIEMDGNAFTVVDFQHVKPGKGAAFVRTKLKNVKTGNVVETTFRAGEKIARANMEKKEYTFLYVGAGDEFTFMDMESYDQINLDRTQLGDQAKWLKEQMPVEILYFQGAIMGISIPNFVELEIVDTPPGVKGDTASGGGKPATLAGGAVVQVPFFVNTGDVVRVDTRTGEYLDRV